MHLGPQAPHSFCQFVKYVSTNDLASPHQFFSSALSSVSESWFVDFGFLQLSQLCRNLSERATTSTATWAHNHTLRYYSTQFNTPFQTLHSSTRNRNKTWSHYKGRSFWKEGLLPFEWMYAKFYVSCLFSEFGAFFVSLLTLGLDHNTIQQGKN